MLVKLFQRFPVLRPDKFVNSVIGMASKSALQDIKEVDIDPEGTFKYILIKVYGPEKGGVEPARMIVRGYKRCPYHRFNLYDFQSFKLSCTKTAQTVQAVACSTYEHESLIEDSRVHLSAIYSPDKMCLLFSGNASKYNFILDGEPGLADNYKDPTL